jgi:hypothetical protein
MSGIKEKDRWSPDAVYQMCGRVVIRRIGSDTLLVPVSGPAAGGRVFPVNESALTVWESVAGGASVQSATEVLAERYALPAGEAREDCLACLETFLKEGLVEEAVR